MNVLSLDEKNKEEAEYSRKIGQVRLGIIPEHIAIIMDGNRRWAKQQELS